MRPSKNFDRALFERLKAESISNEAAARIMEISVDTLTRRLQEPVQDNVQTYPKQQELDDLQAQFYKLQQRQRSIDKELEAEQSAHERVEKQIEASLPLALLGEVPETEIDTLRALRDTHEQRIRNLSDEKTAMGGAVSIIESRLFDALDEHIIWQLRRVGETMAEVYSQYADELSIATETALRVVALGSKVEQLRGKNVRGLKGWQWDNHQHDIREKTQGTPSLSVFRPNVEMLQEMVKTAFETAERRRKTLEWAKNEGLH